MKHDAHVRTAFIHLFPTKYFLLFMFVSFLLGFAISTLYHTWFYQDILFKMSNFE